MSGADASGVRRLEDIGGALDGVGFAGDWHANTAWAVRAIEYAATQGISTLIHTGDFAFTFEREYLDALQAEGERRDVTVLAVRGNHDSTEEIGYLPRNAEGFLEARPRVLMIPDGHRWEINGVSLMGLGGAGSIDRVHRYAGETWWADERLDPRLVDALEGTVDVVISHDSPHGVKLPVDPLVEIHFHRLDDSVVDYCLRNRMVLARGVERVRPSLLVHGHFHLLGAFERPLKPGEGPVATRIVCLDRDDMGLERNVLTAAEVVGLPLTAPVG